MPNQELEAEKMGKKQKELPGMPVNSELKDLCESFIAYKDEISDIKSNSFLVAEKIIEEMKKEKRTAMICEGYRFEIVKKELQLKAVAVK